MPWFSSYDPPSKGVISTPMPATAMEVSSPKGVEIARNLKRVMWLLAVSVATTGAIMLSWFLSGRVSSHVHVLPATLSVASFVPFGNRIITSGNPDNHVFTNGNLGNRIFTNDNLDNHVFTNDKLDNHVFTNGILDNHLFANGNPNKASIYLPGEGPATGSLSEHKHGSATELSSEMVQPAERDETGVDGQWQSRVSSSPAPASTRIGGGPGPRFIVYRAIGNDLPPRHSIGQCYRV